LNRALSVAHAAFHRDRVPYGYRQLWVIIATYKGHKARLTYHTDDTVEIVHAWPSKRHFPLNSLVVLRSDKEESAPGMNKIEPTFAENWNNSATEQYPLIDGLPTELLLHIFHYDDPAGVKRLRLAHVCRRWRIIAIDNASLWTSVEIKQVPDASSECFRKFVSLLELQLERTHVSPLDVVWHISGLLERIAVVLDLILRKGHFCRW
jgi:hypothetical protein